MKKILLVLSMLGIGIAQTSGAAETTFQSNNTLTHTIANISAVSNYGSSRNIYSTNDGAYKSSNDEINKAIDNLSAHAKQKEYQLASLTSRLKYENKGSAHKDSLADMKKWAEQGNVEYQLKVGLIYYQGKGVRQDLVLARKMFQKAANKGNARGQGALGFFYEDGLGGLKRNRATAKEWYGKACDKGLQDGCDEYRRLNERGY
ncbi:MULTISPECIES: tetratricopeptide repeat protein [unclassified Psychrobacter]|uniref:tetratricopeptide repeat protein n=1 Tax=unclassified Psychrobacter TaxID=196806 RepID=UPI0025D43435|nr:MULTISPECIES: tetratricopeptide repeat protein [unclassified Psychrobacter]